MPLNAATNTSNIPPDTVKEADIKPWKDCLVKKSDRDLRSCIEQNVKRLETQAASTKASETALRELGIAPKPAKPPVAPSNQCDQSLFIRADPLDNYYYAVDIGAGNPTGASISYTGNRATGQETANVNGLVSYVVTRSGCLNNPGPPLTQFISGYAIAPWISASGTWNNPIKKGEQSHASAGFDTQFEVTFGPLFDRQYFGVTPFVQTDFRSEARISGVNLSWSPVLYPIALGTINPLNDYLSAGWQFRAEADYVDVEKSGETNLRLGSHEWVGGTARGTVNLFPARGPWPPWLSDRLSIIGTAQMFYDANTGQGIHYHTAAVKYKLSGSSQDPAAPASSISFEWDQGIDKNTMVYLNQYLVKLNYKY